jgi:hypothetical protein
LTVSPSTLFKFRIKAVNPFLHGIEDLNRVLFRMGEQIHRSPGFINSNLVGKSDDGSLIKVRLIAANSSLKISINGQ